MNRRYLSLATHDWKSRPSWLTNPAESYTLEAIRSMDGAGGALFCVQKAGKGMKWTYTCSDNESVSNAGLPCLVVCYRAENIASVSTGQAGSENYFIFIFDEDGNEYVPLYLYDLKQDGHWHGVVALLPNIRIKTIVLQVQAEDDNAYVEIASFCFCSRNDRLLLPSGEEFVINESPGLVTSLHDWFEFEYVNSVHDYPGFTPLALVDQEYDVGISFEGDRFDGIWFERDKISISVGGISIPFHITTESPQLMGRGFSETGEMVVPIRSSAGAIYILLGARFTGVEEPSWGKGTISSISQVERFIIELRYLDGVSELVFPQNTQTGEHVIDSGFGVYAVVPGRKTQVKDVVLHNRMPNGAFYIAGLTVGEEPWPGTKLPQRCQYTYLAGHKTGPGKQEITVEGDDIVFLNEFARVTFTLSDGFEIRSIYNRLTGCEVFLSSTPVFDVLNHGVSSKDIVVNNVEIADSAMRVELSMSFGKAEVIGCFNESGELELELSFTNLSSYDEQVSVIFPSLRNITNAPSSCLNPEDLWYVYPKRGCCIDHRPIEMSRLYSGQFPMQFLSFFNAKGGGFYVIVQDLGLSHKLFELSKSEEGIGSLGVRYDDLVAGTITPGETKTLPKVSLGVCPGDWHHAFDAYTRWVKTWYRPLVSRKEWFRKVGSFRQQSLHFAYPEKSGIFNENDRTISFDLALSRDQKAFGSVDYLHLYDWSWSPQTGRVGDYAPWKYLGPKELLRAEIDKTNEQGIPVGLYLNGYSVDPRWGMLQRDDAKWFLVDYHGCVTSISSPLLTFCPYAPKWQDYLVETCKRVCLETNAKGLYIDEFGLADYERACYAETHGHGVPAYPLPAEGAMLQRIREAIPEETVIYTGESPVDVISQYQDGSFTYALCLAIAEGSPHRLNLYRFAFPDFKTIEIVVCDKPLGSDYDSLKSVLFNGEAIWLMGTATRWFAPETLAFIQKMTSIYRRHMDAFTSLNPTPLYPTLLQDVYANQFSAQDENLWTVYNANFRTVDGELLAVPHRKGAIYMDVWNETPIIPHVEEGVAYLSFSIDPKGVGVIVQQSGPTTSA
ncbi:MAG: DUF6259 domain-containing protein [Limnochordia bacterium]|nr:DUF6259 domain-containing protein [Limnochordia bacterium]